MSIYDDLKIVSNEILTEFNQGTVKYIKKTYSVGPADEPDEPSETEYEVKGTVQGVNQYYVINSRAKGSDKTAIITPIEGVEKSLDDLIIVDDERYNIVEDLSPPASGTQVIWKFIIRKG